MTHFVRYGWGFGSLSPGKGEICHPTPQSKHAIENCCCHLGNASDELGGFARTIPLFVKLLWCMCVRAVMLITWLQLGGEHRLLSLSTLLRLLGLAWSAYYAHSLQRPGSGQRAKSTCGFPANTAGVSMAIVATATSAVAATASDSEASEKKND